MTGESPILTACLIGGCVASAFAALFFFVWGVRSGHLDDLEDTKFRMLREDENR